MSPRCRVGTSGWVYAHWRGAFYPSDLPQSGWYAHYAGHFDTVEINYSFYNRHAAAVDICLVAIVGDERTDARPQRRNKQLRWRRALFVPAHNGWCVNEDAVISELGLKEHVTPVIRGYLNRPQRDLVRSWKTNRSAMMSLGVVGTVTHPAEN